MKLEEVKKLQQAKLQRKEEMFWYEKSKAKRQNNLAIQLEEINQKILAKKRKLKR